MRKLTFQTTVFLAVLAASGGFSCAQAEVAPASGIISGAITIDGRNEVKGFKLQEAVVYLKPKQLANADDKPKTKTVGGVINQKDKAYVPHVLAVKAGSIVEFQNDDPDLHNVHSESAENPEFNMASVPGTAPVKRFFAKAEVVKLTCNVHPDMLAFLVVCPDEHFTMASASGEYQLSNIPPGEYTVTLWQEKFEPVTRDVIVKNGETLTLNFPLERSQAIRRR